MDYKKLKEPSIRLKGSAKSSMRIGQPETASHSSHGLHHTGNNTSPIICAVCGSKEYIPLHSLDKCNYPFGPSLGWNSPDLLKKNLSMEFPQTCGPLSPLAQTIFPHLSLLHIPSNFYCSNMRFPFAPCEQIEKYLGHVGLELNGSKTSAVTSESTFYRENETEKTKSGTARVARDSTFRKEESANGSFKKEDSRSSSAFTNVSEVRNYPVAVHPPWMGNFCPVFPYTYPSWPFPFNHPMIPLYFPVASKWQGVENRNEDVNVESSPSNSPVGDSVQDEPDKKCDQRDENNASEYDFEVFARELLMEQKSNYDEDEVDIEVNLDEIANSLKTAGVNSGREINSEKFFNSKEKLKDSSREPCQDKSEMPNWKLSSEVNMQDCCIRTLSSENLWYEAQDDDKKNWDNFQDSNWKENGYKSPKHNAKEDSRSGNREKEKIGDGQYEPKKSSSSNKPGKSKENFSGVFHETNSVWKKDQNPEPKTRIYWKKNSRNDVLFEESPEISNDNRKDWSKSQTEINDEIEFSEDKISSLKDNARVRGLHVINDATSKLDMRYDYAEDPENTSQTPNRETTRDREDNYSIQINAIEIDYSVGALEDDRNRGKEDNRIGKEENFEFRKREMEKYARDNIDFNWDKIKEILDDYNEKFANVGLILKHKHVLGAKMAKAYSPINNRKQKNSHLTISDSSKSATDDSENAHGDRKTELKSTGPTPRSPPVSPNGNKIRRDEKSRSFGYTPSKYDALKIPVSNSRKSKKQEDTKKRWLT